MVKSFKNIKSIPSRVQELSLDSLREQGAVIELVRANDISPDDFDKTIVLPGATVAGVDPKTGDVYSYSPTSNTYSKYRKGKVFITYTNEAGILVNISTRQFKKSKNNNNISINGGETMEPNNNVIGMSPEDFEKEIGGIDFDNVNLGGEINIPPTMTTFSDAEAADAEAEKAKKAAEREAYKAVITGLKKDLVSDVSPENVQKAVELGVFNRTHGGLLGFIVTAEPSIKFGKVKEFLLQDGKKIPNDTATDAIRAKIAAGEKVAAEYYVQQSAIKVRQAGPTGIKGGVLEIPVGGLFTPKQILQGNFELDPNQKDTKKILYNKEDLYKMIKLAFGGKVYDRSVSAKKEVLVISLVDKKSSEKTKTQVIKDYMKAPKGSTLFNETNFFPLKTFETLNVSQHLSEADADVASVSAFWNFFRITKSKATPSYSELGAAYSARLQPKDDERVPLVSEYFKSGSPANWFGAEPTHWLTGEVLTTVNVPVRDLDKVNDKGVHTYPFKQYTMTSAEALSGNVAYLEHTALYRPEYQTVVNRIGADILQPQTLKDVLNKSRNSGSKSAVDNALSFAEQYAADLKSLQGTIDSSRITVSTSFDDDDRLLERFAEAKNFK